MAGRGGAQQGKVRVPIRLTQVLEVVCNGPMLPLRIRPPRVRQDCSLGSFLCKKTRGESIQTTGVVPAKRRGGVDMTGWLQAGPVCLGGSG